MYVYTETWYSKSTEAHRQNQEGDGHAFAVGISNHQQQSGLHAKSWHTHTLVIKVQIEFIICYISDRYQIDEGSRSTRVKVSNGWIYTQTQHWGGNRSPSGGEAWRRDRVLWKSHPVSVTTDPGLLTSTVHDFPDSGGGQDVPAAEVVGQLATDGHNDGHNQMRQGREYANLQSRQITTQLENSWTLM